MAIDLQESDGWCRTPQADEERAEGGRTGQRNEVVERAGKTRLYPLILLDLATGVRCGELLALQWPIIDFESEVMNIAKSPEQMKAGLA
jgi:integrase